MLDRTPRGRPDLHGLTLRYAEHVHGLTYDALPAEVVEKAKWIIRDSVGNQIAASAISEPARKLVELVEEWGGAPQCTISGYGVKVPAPMAAMCNAALAHSVELDDADGTGLLKAGSILVPAVLGAAELRQSSGRDVISALVAGYDVSVRIAKAINPGHRQRGYHTSGTVSVFGAAAAVAKLLGCNAEAIAWAMGLAGMQSAGIQSYLDDPCMAKPFSPGKAAFNGAIAGIMASRGFTGPRKVLESREGFFNAFASEVNDAELDNRLGSHFSIMEVGFKPHAACRYAHRPIDLAQEIHHLDGVRLEDVRQVEADMSRLAIRQASKPECANLNVAMGSTEFSLVLALAAGRNGLRDYWSMFGDRAMHEALVRVRLVEEPAFGAGGRQARVRVTTNDGRILSRESEIPKGEPENPITADELHAKFCATSGLVLDETDVMRINEMTMSLDVDVDPRAISAATIVGRAPELRAA